MDTKCNTFSITEQQYLIANYSVIGATHCAKNLGKTRHSVRRIAKQLGLQLDRSKIMLHAYKKSFDKYNVNPTGFIVPDKMSAVNAYLLGFIWADGHISFRGTAAEISARFVSDDSYDLIPLFQKTGKWSVYTQHPPGCREATIVSTNNRPFAEYLDKFGYSAKSSGSAVDILNQIPEHFHHYWWRGCFDGDGCFYVGRKYNQIGLYSTYEQDWTHFDNLCKNIGVGYTITKTIRSKGKSSSVRISSKNDMTTFIHYLYPDGFDLGLKRKYDKAIQILYSNQ